MADPSAGIPPPDPVPDDLWAAPPGTSTGGSPPPPPPPMAPPPATGPHGTQQYGTQPYAGQQYGGQQYGSQQYGAPAAPGYGGPGGYGVAPSTGAQVLPVPPHKLASPGMRFGGLLLTIVLVVVTLFIGYLVWAVIAWSSGTTPAKQVLGMRVIDARSGAPATFGQMVMRQFVWTLVLGFGSSVTFGILGIVDAFFVFGDTRQRLLDKMAGTLVVRR